MGVEGNDDITRPHRTKSHAVEKAGGIAAKPNSAVNTEQYLGQAKTVYPDLPAEAFNFTFSGIKTVDNLGVDIVTAEYVIFEQDVPDGFVLYTKEYRAYIQNCFSTTNPALSGIPNVNTLVTLKNRQNADQFNQKLVTEPLPGWNPCYLIAGQNMKVVVTMAVDFTPMPIKPTNLQIITYIRGQALKRNNMQPIYTALAVFKRAVGIGSG